MTAYCCGVGVTFEKRAGLNSLVFLYDRKGIALYLVAFIFKGIGFRALQRFKIGAKMSSSCNLYLNKCKIAKGYLLVFDAKF